MRCQIQVEWQEDADELKALYLSEKDYQNRTRRQALGYLRQRRTAGAVADLVGRHPGTIQDWIRESVNSLSLQITVFD